MHSKSSITPFLHLFLYLSLTRYMCLIMKKWKSEFCLRCTMKKSTIQRLTYNHISVWTVTRSHDWMSKSSKLHNAWVREPSPPADASHSGFMAVSDSHTSTRLQVAFTIRNPISYYSYSNLDILWAKEISTCTGRKKNYRSLKMWCVL